MKLKYIGSKTQQLIALREVAQELLNEQGGYLADDLEHAGYERDIKEIEDVEEMEKLIRDLEEDIIKGKLRETEENCEPKDDLLRWYYSRVL